jgi:hypothetical protein
MKLYLAGPMRGIPEFNFPAFHAAAKMLRDMGHEVFSPAENDINQNGGKDFSKDYPTGSEAEATKNLGFSLRKALGEDLAWICAEAEGVALLPGWSNSKGALAEKATAEALGIKVLYIAPQGRLYSADELIDSTVAPAIANFDTVR